jgi:DNA-binding FrmR family transcriptional regulator
MTDVRGYSLDKDNYLARLRRIEGQIRGLQRMIDEDRYCIDVLNQIASATAALDAVALGLVDEHIRHCVMDAAATGNVRDRDTMLTEAVAAVERLLHR